CCSYRSGSTSIF
nr:immunoglobulin light chain junction region [Macaca mulatta]MPO04200.1 immunoglobulin light chain junction region [Macaca mulatta]MPO04344.1 immunoglobulin light chain junction region [Macaca mulatta]MPO04681.1 immunoglobulin light chain junction region [Macaca mulatta]MPO04993.1 immunoglobulin light chain junction region [Macaca mulatta]